MVPKYQHENQYSIYPITPVPQISSNYVVEQPETRFEKQVYFQYHQAKTYLFKEEYALALNAFSDIRQLILKTVNPQLPPHPKPPSKGIGVLADIKVLDPLINKTGEILTATPALDYALPETIFNDKNSLPATVSNKINKVQISGEMQTVSYHNDVSGLIDKVYLATEKKDWNSALENLNVALRVTPTSDKLLQGSLLHDIGIILEKNNKKDEAERSIEESISLFKSGKAFESQADALQSLANLQFRGDREEAANATMKKKNKLIRDKNLHEIISSPGRRLTNVIPVITGPITDGPILPGIGRSAPSPSNRNVGSVVATNLEAAQASVLFGKQYLNNQDAKVEKKIFMHGDIDNIELKVNTNVKANLNAMYTMRASSSDFQLLTGFLMNPVQMVAYLPHIYFFVLPMAMGDCFHGMGRFKSAEELYLSTLKYPFINKHTEIVNLWLRIAENLLEQADIAYRRAGDNSNNFAAAKSLYEKLVRTNGSLLSGSPLYKDVKFADVKTRVSEFLQPFIANFTSAFWQFQYDGKPSCHQ